MSPGVGGAVSSSGCCPPLPAQGGEVPGSAPVVSLPLEHIRCLATPTSEVGEYCVSVPHTRHREWPLGGIPFKEGARAPSGTCKGVWCLPRHPHPSPSHFLRCSRSTAAHTSCFLCDLGLPGRDRPACEVSATRPGCGERWPLGAGGPSEDAAWSLPTADTGLSVPHVRHGRAAGPLSNPKSLRGNGRLPTPSRGGRRTEGTGSGLRQPHVASGRACAGGTVRSPMLLHGGPGAEAGSRRCCLWESTGGAQYRCSDVFAEKGAIF